MESRGANRLSSNVRIDAALKGAPSIKNGSPTISIDRRRHIR